MALEDDLIVWAERQSPPVKKAAHEVLWFLWMLDANEPDQAILKALAVRVANLEHVQLSSVKLNGEVDV